MKIKHKLVLTLATLVANYGFSQSKTPLFQNSLKPEVYMGMPNISDLANTADFDKWTYVRENLNGLWINGAGTGQSNIITITKAVTTRNFIFIAPLTQRTPTFVLGGGFYNFHQGFLDAGIIFNNPGLAVVNDYISKSAKDPLRYYFDGDMNLVTDYLNNNNPNGQPSPFGQNYYITTRHGSYLADIFNPVKSATDPLVGQSYQTALDSKGIVYERDAKDLSLTQAYKDSYIQAFNLAKANGKDFIWLCPRGNDGTTEELVQGLKDSYIWMATNKVFPNKLVLANYTREENPLAMFPMIDPNDSSITPSTFTGILYWAIKQYQTNPVNLLKNAIFNGDSEWFGQPSSCFGANLIRYDATPSESHTNDGSGSWIIECTSDNARIRNSTLVTTPNTTNATGTYQVSVWVKRESTNGEEGLLRIFLTEPGQTPSINIESNEGIYTTSGTGWQLVTMTFNNVKNNTEYYINFNKKRQTGFNADRIRLDEVNFNTSEAISELSVKDHSQIQKSNFIKLHFSGNDLVISNDINIQKTEVYNVLGQQVFSQKGDSKSLPLGNLIKGIYVIKIYTENNIYSKKFLKN